MPQQSVAVVIVAAGRGERAASNGTDDPKQYRRIGGKTVLERTIAAFLDHPRVNHVLPVIHAEHQERYSRLGMQSERLLKPVTGAATRQGSVLEGLRALGPLRPDIVLIQDAARPFISPALIDRVLEGLSAAPAALPALPVTDTIKRSNDGREVSATEDRRLLHAAQTPQGFRFGQILSGHMRAAGTGREFTDDAAIAEWAGLSVVMVPGEANNIKITHPQDFAQAERIISGDRAMETRIGTGYDVHSFAEGSSVWLGGVEIPHTARLDGHSDADVALHALTDALLGAIGEADIGIHFPPSDPQWRGAASTVFLRHAGDLVARAGGRIVNVDVTIVCEAPRIATHVPAMRAVIGGTLGISPSRVAIKATTNEKLGFIGREEGIVAMASASVEMPRVD